MPFTFTLSGESRDVSYLSLIDAEQLFSSNDKADSDVRRNTLALLTSNPIVVPHTWFVSERAWHTTQKVIATLQCALQYRHYVNKHTMRRRNLEMLKLYKKYKLERDDAVKELKMTREESIKYKHEMQAQMLQSKEAEHALSKLIAQRRRDIDTNKCRMTKLSSNNTRKNALTCSQCGNVYPSVKSLQSHIIKRHKRSRAFAENTANNIAASAATALATNAETNLYSDLYNEDNFNYASFPFIKKEEDNLYNLITGNAKSDMKANNELLELLEDALHTVDQLHKESDLQSINEKESDIVEDKKEILSVQKNRPISRNVTVNAEHHIAQGISCFNDQQKAENAFVGTMLLPGMKTENVPNQVIHNKENTNDTLRELLEETLLRLQNFETQYMLHPQEKTHFAAQADKQCNAKCQESANCNDAGVQTIVEERANQENGDTFLSKTYNKSPHELTSCPNWLKLPTAEKLNTNEEHLHNKKESMQCNLEEEQKQLHALDSQKTSTQEAVKVHNLSTSNQVPFTLGSEHDAKDNVLTVDEHIKLMETSPSTAMAISPITVSPLSASNLPSPTSLPSSSVHVTPLPILSKELTVTDNVVDEKSKPIDHIELKESNKETQNVIASLTDIAQTLISDPSSRDEKLIAAVQASRQSIKTRYNDVNSAERNDSVINDTIRSTSSSSSVNTTQVEKQHYEREEEELKEEKQEPIEEERKNEQEQEQEQQHHEEEEKKEKREIDVAPLKVESLAEPRSTDKLDAPAFSISPKSLEPRKHAHNEHNWLTDEQHVHEAIRTSKAFTEKPVVLNLPAPQEVGEEDESQSTKISTSSPKQEKIHEGKIVRQDVKSKLLEEKEEFEEKKKEEEISAAPSCTSQYAYDESSSPSSSSSYSFTSTAESSKENDDNYSKNKSLHDQRKSEEHDEKMEKTTREKQENVNAKLSEEKHASKQERNTTYDDVTAFTISYEDEEDVRDEYDDYDSDNDNYGEDKDKDARRGNEQEEHRLNVNNNINKNELKSKTHVVQTTNTLDNNMSEKDPTRPTLANIQHEEYQEQEQQEQKNAGQGKHVASMPRESHRSIDLSSYIYSDDAFTETDHRSSSHYLQETDHQRPQSPKETQEDSKLEQLTSQSKEQKLTNIHQSTSLGHSTLQHRRHRHSHHHHHHHRDHDQQHNDHKNDDEGNSSSFSETRKQKDELEQSNKERQLSSHNVGNSQQQQQQQQQQLVHTENNNNISLRPNTSTISNTAESKSASRIHMLPSTYASSLASVTIADSTANINEHSNAKTHKTSLLSMKNKVNVVNNSRMSLQDDYSTDKITNNSSTINNNKSKKRKAIKNFFKNIFKSKNKAKNTDNNSRNDNKKFVN